VLHLRSIHTLLLLLPSLLQQRSNGRTVVLGVVFFFADFQQLATMMAVCRAWQQVGRTMPRLQLRPRFSSSEAFLAKLLHSRPPVLSRHLGELNDITVDSTFAALLNHMAERLSHLTALTVTVRYKHRVKQFAPLRFSAAIRQLKLRFIVRYADLFDLTPAVTSHLSAVLSNAILLPHLKTLVTACGAERAAAVYAAAARLRNSLCPPHHVAVVPAKPIACSKLTMPETGTLFSQDARHADDARNNTAGTADHPL
jgi:hypothetical protein